MSNVRRFLGGVILMAVSAAFAQTGGITQTDAQVKATTDRTATIQWSTNIPSRGTLYYGHDPSMTKMEEVHRSDVETGHVFSLTNLEPNTTYYFKVENRTPSGSVMSGVKTFRTMKGGELGGTGDLTITVPPSVVRVSDHTATIHWSTNIPSRATVYYGHDPTFAKMQEAEDTSLVTGHEFALSNLEPHSTYYFKVVCKNPSGNVSSNRVSFATN